jgi:hypothetical protein
MLNRKSNILIEDINWNGDQELVRFISSFRGERIDSFGLITVYRLKLPGTKDHLAR